jgi:GNAT superfamily N-acetyltransferase
MHGRLLARRCIGAIVRDRAHAKRDGLGGARGSAPARTSLARDAADARDARWRYAGNARPRMLDTTTAAGSAMIRITNHTEPRLSAELQTELTERVRSFNYGIVGRYEFEPMACVAHDDDGDLIGGAAGNVGLGWLHVDVLWVAERHRGRDLGSRVMDGLEALALRHGARRSRVETTSFQALDFYRKRGYVVFGQIEDLPDGHTFYYLQRRLDAS